MNVTLVRDGLDEYGYIENDEYIPQNHSAKQMLQATPEQQKRKKSTRSKKQELQAQESCEARNFNQSLRLPGKRCFLST